MFTCPHCGQQFFIAMDEAESLPPDVQELLARPARVVPVKEHRFDAPPNGVGRAVETSEGTAFFVDPTAIQRRRDEVMRSKEKR